VHLPRSRRIENVRGAFEVGDAQSLHGARVLLVDDVTTTGATANEAARALLRAGASSVTLAVLGKAEPPQAYSKAPGA
jgi:predicted amidophosphoribosyltransferase